jgi:ABC-type hemin transport system substrate-binding protein
MSIFPIRYAVSMKLGAYWIWAALLLSLALPLGCGEGSEERSSPQVRPERAAVDQAPMRIVSLGASATQFLLELGVGHQLVGVDAESVLLPGLMGVPVVDLQSALSVAPDLVLVPKPRETDLDVASELEASGARWVEFEPHDLEDVGALTRGLGAQIVGIAAAARFERRFSRPLALVAGIQPPRDRLRVVAVIDLDPLTLAGGHSFETDLIEIGGGSSVTHGGSETRIVATQAEWESLEPDLVIIVTREEMGPDEREQARSVVPARFAIDFFEFDRESFWLYEPEKDADRMRRLLASAALTLQK